MSSSTPTNYGAIKTTTDEEDATGDSFDPDQERYIRDTSPPLTFGRFAALAIPILGAVLIVGGATLLILKSHMYPGRGGDRTSYGSRSSSISNRSPLTPRISDTSSVRVPGPPHRGNYDHGSGTPPGSNQRPPLSPPTEKEGGDDGGDEAGSCSSHPACADLGLLGDCCPTSGGIFLTCCN